MSKEDQAVEFYRKYRPKGPKEMVGQAGVLDSLKGLGKKGALPHCLLFTGPSGTGKTTICRFLKAKLKCTDHDYREINIAKDTGVDVIRRIEKSLMLSPFGGGKCKIYMLDEVHAATKNAQSCLLKMLEDTPPHVYFFLATTNPEKLLPTIITRATHFKLSSVAVDDLVTLVNRVAKEEGFSLTEAVADKIAEYSDGSCRKALVILQQISEIEGEDAQLEAIAKADAKTEAIELARALIGKKGQWSKVAALIKKFDDDPEAARRIILGYASSVLLGGGPQSARAFLVIDSFRDNFFDSGKAGLVAAAYEVFNG